MQAGFLPSSARALAFVPATLPRRTRGPPIAAASCASSANTCTSTMWLLLPSGSRQCAHGSGWCMPSAPLPGPKRCWPICRVTRTESRISNQRLVALDEHGVTSPWKDYRVNGRTCNKTMTLELDEFARRFLLHVLPSIRAVAELACTPRRRSHIPSRTTSRHTYSTARP